MAITQQDNPGKAPMSSWAKLVARRSLRMLTQVSNGWGQQAPAGADAFDPFAGVGGLGRHDAAGMSKGKGKGRETPSSPWAKKGAGSPFASGASAEKTSGSARSRRAAEEAARGAPPSPFEAISAPIRAPRKPVERKPRKASGPGGLVSKHQERSERSEPKLNPRPERMPDLLALAQTRAMQKRIDRFDAGVFSSVDDKIWRATAERQAQLKEKIDDLFDIQALKPRAPALWAPPGIIMDGPRKGAGANQDATAAAAPAQPLALSQSESLAETISAQELASPSDDTEAPSVETPAAGWPFSAVIGEVAPAAPQVSQPRDDESSAGTAPLAEDAASMEPVLALLPKTPIEFEFRPEFKPELTPEAETGAANAQTEIFQALAVEIAEKTAPMPEAALALTQADGQSAFGFMAPEGAQNAVPEGSDSALSDERDETTNGESENAGIVESETPEALGQPVETQLPLDLGQGLAGWVQTDGQLAFQFTQAESLAEESGAERQAEASQHSQDTQTAADIAEDERVALWAVGEQWEQRCFDWGRAIPGWRQADGQFAFHFTEAIAMADIEALSQWAHEANAKDAALAEERLAQEEARALADQRDQERAELAQRDLEWDKPDPGWEQDDGQFAFAFTQTETPSQLLDFQILAERANHEQSTAKQQRVKDLYAEKSVIRAQDAWIAKMGWAQGELEWRELPAQEMTGLSAIRLIATEALAYASVLGAPMQEARAQPDNLGTEDLALEDAAEEPASDSFYAGEFDDVEFPEDLAPSEESFTTENHTEEWGEFSVIEEPEARPEGAGADLALPETQDAADRATQGEKQSEQQEPPLQKESVEQAPPHAPSEFEPVADQATIATLAPAKPKKKKWKATPFRPYAPQDAAEALATAWDANAIATDDLAEEILGAGHLEDEAESEIDWLTGGDPEKIANWEYESAPLALREHPAFRGIGAETAQNRLARDPRHQQETDATLETYPAPAASPRPDRNEPAAARDREAQEFMDAILGDGASHSEPQPVESLQAWKERQLREEREAAEADFEGHYVSQTARIAETRDLAEQGAFSEIQAGPSPSKIEQEQAELALQHESQLREQEENEAAFLAQEELHAQAGHEAQAEEQSSPWGDEPLPDLFADAMASAFGAQNARPAPNAEAERSAPLPDDSSAESESGKAGVAEIWQAQAHATDDFAPENTGVLAEEFEFSDADFEDVEFDNAELAPIDDGESTENGRAKSENQPDKAHEGNALDGNELSKRHDERDEIANDVSQNAPSQAHFETPAERGRHERFATLAAKQDGDSNSVARAGKSIERVRVYEPEPAEADAQSFMSADPALLDGLLDAATAAPRHGYSSAAQFDLFAPEGREDGMEPQAEPRVSAEEPYERQETEAGAEFADEGVLADEPERETSSHAEPSGEGESVVRPDHSSADATRPAWIENNAAEADADAEKRLNGKDMERELGLDPMENATIRESGKLSLGSILGARENRDSFSEDVKNMSDEELADSPEGKKKPVESLFSSLLEQAKGVFAGGEGKSKKAKKKEEASPMVSSQPAIARGDNRVDGVSSRSGWGVPLQPGESRKIDLSRLRQEAQTALDGAEKAQPGQPLLRAEMFLARLLARHPKTSLRWRAAPPVPKNGLDWSSDSRGSQSTSASMPLGASAPVVGKLWAQTAPLPMPGDAQWEEERKAGHEAAIGALKHFWQNAQKEERERLAAIVCCAQSQQGALTAATFEAAVNAVVPPMRARAARNELEDVMSQGDPDWI